MEKDKGGKGEKASTEPHAIACGKTHLLIPGAAVCVPASTEPHAIACGKNGSNPHSQNSPSLQRSHTLSRVESRNNHPQRDAPL